MERWEKMDGETEVGEGERKREGWDYGERKRVREVEWYRMWKGVRQKDENIASLSNSQVQSTINRVCMCEVRARREGGGGLKEDSWASRIS